MKSLAKVLTILVIGYAIGSAVTALLFSRDAELAPLNAPLTLGNNMRKAYTLRPQEGDVGVVEFETEQGGHCVLALTEVTISGHQSVALDCLEN